jgi:hypothetical protein
MGMNFVLIAVLTLSSQFGNGNCHQLSNAIRPTTDEATQQQAALDVIRRLINDRANDVAIKINFNLPGNYFKVSGSLISFYTRFGRR